MDNNPSDLFIYLCTALISPFLLDPQPYDQFKFSRLHIVIFYSADYVKIGAMKNHLRGFLALSEVTLNLTVAVLSQCQRDVEEAV